MRSAISNLRTLCYRGARFMGWLRAAEDVIEGRPGKAVKIVANKVIGRRLVSRCYFK